jgi:hypothetical protein
VTPARVALRHALPVSIALAAVAPAPAAAPAPLHGTACAPAACALEAPTPQERAALLAESDRLSARWADDTTALGRDCRALGTTMRARLAEVRMLPVMWRMPDEDGFLAPVTGDAHTVEPQPGAGRVHIARGYDTLNPDRGLDAILETARHEFAHLNGMGRRQRWGVDEGANLAIACAPETR